MTEHGNVDSAIQFSNQAAKAGLKFIAGCEFYICKDMAEKNPQKENRHVCIYAMNAAGWSNILRMLSQANIRGYYYRPRIDPDLLLGHLDGLIVSTACVAGFAGVDWGLELFGNLAEAIPDRFFCEIQPHGIPAQVRMNKAVLKLARKYGLRTIATNDCHYPYPEDAKLQDICLAINSGADYDDPKRLKFDSEFYYAASESEMIDWFCALHPYLEERTVISAINGTQALVDMCEDFRLEKINPDLPIPPSVPMVELQLKNQNEDDYFKYLIMKGLAEKKGELCAPLHDYRVRIKEELSVLLPKGFARYFLIVLDIMDFCRRENIYMGPGRGSVGGCLCAWLTGITQVDPIKYGLLFARFQDPERFDLPDIDGDYEMDYRDKVVDYIRATYGEQNVAQITTFLTMQGKMALQDVGRVFHVPRERINAVTKNLHADELTRESFLEDPVARAFLQDFPEIVENAMKIQGTIRGYGKHAAGVCISKHNLANGINCNLVRRGSILMSNWDKDEGEFMGLMKLDILGLKALSRLRVCVEMIRKGGHPDFRLEDIDVEDRKALALINSGKCVGIFQLGTKGLRNYCMELGVSSFMDVYNATALYRPGPLDSGMAEEFVKRKHGAKWTYMHPKMKPFTSDTYGIIVYQEQFMFAFKELAGFSWAKCNKVRKVMAKSQGQDALNEYRDDFIRGCLDVSGLKEAESSRIWESIVTFAAYAFNKSHSVEYSVITLWDAYLKAHHPGCFYASCLSYLDEDKRVEMVEECIVRGYSIKLPKFGLSDDRIWQYDRGTKSLLMPFREINGVGDRNAAMIAECARARRRTFFGNKADLSRLPKSCVQILNDIHAFDPDWKVGRGDVRNLRGLFKFNLMEIAEST